MFELQEVYFVKLSEIFYKITFLLVFYVKYLFKNL